MKKVIGKVVETDEYGMFHRLLGNRSVTATRVRKLIASMKAHGYIGSPIVTNEKYEVIDGQARLETCRELGMPIPYTVNPGSDLKECVALNRYTTAWSIQDYIDMYVEEGKPDYIYLNNLLKAYCKKGIRQNAVYFAATGQLGNTTATKNGAIKIDEAHYEQACLALEYVTFFVPYLKRANVKLDVYEAGIIFSYYHPETDNDTLLRNVERNQMELIEVQSIVAALESLEKIYNYRNRKKAYLATDYKKQMADKYGWYAKKWGGEQNE